MPIVHLVWYPISLSPRLLPCNKTSPLVSADAPPIGIVEDCFLPYLFSRCLLKIPSKKRFLKGFLTEAWLVLCATWHQLHCCFLSNNFGTVIISTCGERNHAKKWESITSSNNLSHDCNYVQIVELRSDVSYSHYPPRFSGLLFPTAIREQSANYHHYSNHLLHPLVGLRRPLFRNATSIFSSRSESRSVSIDGLQRCKDLWRKTEIRTSYYRIGRSQRDH